jgi:hypothetical protein
VATLDLAVDRPSAFVAVRLCDVAPDGALTRVTFGVLNLTHRDGHADPRPMSPGSKTTIRVQLNDTAYAFLPGHRLRLAISTDYWPMVWPSPEPVSLTIHAGAVELPVRPPRSDDADLADLGEPTWGPPAATTELRAGRWGRETRTDAMLGETPSRTRSKGHWSAWTAPVGPCTDRLRPGVDPTTRPRPERQPARIRDRPRRRRDPRLRRARPVVHHDRLRARRPHGRQGGRDGRLDRDWDFTIPRDNI